VRLKKEIISMGCPEIEPEKQTAPHLEPVDFKQWYDEGKDMIVLDTRNDYEIRLGTFEAAMDLGIDHFRQFPEAIKKLPESFKKKPVVTFCTGGIRCEKAAELMKREGFEQVYQLNGGIINYFEQCGGDHYEGECFVFDKRVALDPALQETQAVQCYKCREPLTIDQLQECGSECPYCHQSGGLPKMESNHATDTL
jgi:predicted sulfurtransferase